MLIKGNNVGNKGRTPEDEKNFSKNFKLIDWGHGPKPCKHMFSDISKKCIICGISKDKIISPDEGKK